MTRVPDQEAKKYDWGGGGALIGLPPQQLLSHHATVKEPLIAYNYIRVIVTFCKRNTVMTLIALCEGVKYFSMTFSVNVKTQ